MPIRVHTSEEARKNGALGGKKSGESKRRKKELAEYLKLWSEMAPKDKDLSVLKKIFPENTELSNKALLVIPLIKKASSGDLKAIDMIVKLLGEDRKLEAEIERLKAENELLKSGNGSLLEKITINMDVKSDGD